MADARCAVTVLDEGPVHGSWDRSRVDQVVMNLLANAMKYAANKPIKVSIRRVGQAAELVVQDQGIGIGEADQQRIFERFERAGSVQNHCSGLGLGLYIVQQIVTAHGGSIRVQSELGHGARFVVRLPLHDEELASRGASGRGRKVPLASAGSDKAWTGVVASGVPLLQSSAGRSSS